MLPLPAFVLTFKPVSYSSADAKNRALQQEAIPAVIKPAPQVSVDVAASGYASPVPGSQLASPMAGPQQPELAELERERAPTIDAGTMDYGDVNALKRNVYNNEDMKEEEEKEANEDDVGFVIHQ